MHPKLASCALVVLAGCQAGNPYAAFGPATIPAPGMQTPAPYYAATATASPPSSAGIAEPAGSHAYEAPASRFMADSSDSQPIRIVENPAAIRTATAPASASPSPNAGPQAAPGSVPPAAAPPIRDRLRGFIPASPAMGHPATRLDPRVVPAAYQQPGTFAEPPAAAGLWKAR
jgi:hypothetical protein